jgi:septum formation protein
MAFAAACAKGSNPGTQYLAHLRKSYHCRVRLILASASPRRAELLRSAGYEFETRPVDIDESPKNGETPVAYVERLAMEKSARALLEVSGFIGTIVLGADTAVVVGDEILGKPNGNNGARRMLRRLSGRSHLVMTGVCLRTTQRSVSHVEITSVIFASLTEAQIAWYVASGEGLDKAGAYAIQGLASRFIPRIEGSYSNVVGLPIAVVDDLIQRLTDTRPVLASGQ